jgi:hypothetical protein
MTSLTNAAACARFIDVLGPFPLKERTFDRNQDGRGRGVNDLSAGALIILATVISVAY